MYLLIDECCGNALVRVAEGLGHTAQRTKDVASLGRGASDAEICRFASDNGAIVVTANHRDFEALAAATEHPGMIFVPPVLGSELAKLFKAVLPTAEAVFAGSRSQIVEIDESERITSFSA